MEITVQELKQRIKSGENINIIDVREEWEYEESNIVGATNIPLHSLPESTENLGDKHSEIIIHCRSGVRGNTARAVLNQLGYSNVKNLTGGILAFYA